jgi:hypothetical protein
MSCTLTSYAFILITFILTYFIIEVGHGPWGRKGPVLVIPELKVSCHGSSLFYILTTERLFICSSLHFPIRIQLLSLASPIQPPSPHPHIQSQHMPEVLDFAMTLIPTRSVTPRNSVHPRSIYTTFHPTSC